MLFEVDLYSKCTGFYGNADMHRCTSFTSFMTVTNKLTGYSIVRLLTIIA